MCIYLTSEEIYVKIKGELYMSKILHKKQEYKPKRICLWYMVTIWQAIKETVSELGRIFSAKEMVRIINERYPNHWKESAVYAHL